MTDAAREMASTARAEADALEVALSVAASKVAEAQARDVIAVAGIAADRAASLHATRNRDEVEVEVSVIEDLVHDRRLAVNERHADVAAGADALRDTETRLTSTRGHLDTCLSDVNRGMLRSILYGILLPIIRLSPRTTLFRKSSVVARASKVAAEIGLATGANISLASELATAHDRSVSFRLETTRIETEACKLSRIAELASTRLTSVGAALDSADAQCIVLQRALETSVEESIAARRSNEFRASALGSARRATTELSDKKASTSNALLEGEAVLQAAKRETADMQREIEVLRSDTVRVRKILVGAQLEMERMVAAAALATADSAATMEAIKLQELQDAALTRRSSDNEARSRAQAKLYDAAKVERDHVENELVISSAGLETLRSAYVRSTLASEKLRDDIRVKDAALLREHALWHKVGLDDSKQRWSCRMRHIAQQDVKLAYRTADDPGKSGNCT